MKKLILFGLLFNFLFCQNFTIQAQCKGWYRTSGIGGPSDEHAECLHYDTINNSFFLTGSYASDSLVFSTGTIYNGGLRNAFVIKYDSAGSVQWANNIGRNNIDYALGVSTDIAGNVYCTGNFRSDTVVIGSDTLINNGGDDVFIVRYDAAGNIIWAESEGGENFEFVQSIAVDTSGNLFVAGGFQSSEIIFGTDTLANVGYSDAFIAKFSDGGENIWATTIGGSEIDYFENVVTDNSGFVYVSGVFQSDSLYFGSHLLVNMGRLDFFISKLDSDGNIIWVSGFGGNHDDFISDIATDNSGNVYITGNYQSNSLILGNNTLINNGERDIFYAKIDHLGNVVWSKSTGGVNKEFPSFLDLTGPDEIYLSGSFRSQSLIFDTLFVISNSPQPGFMVKLDAMGNVVWTKLVGEAEDSNVIQDLAVDKNGDIYLTGDFDGDYLSFGPETILNKDVTGFYSDIYILKLVDYNSPPIPQITLFDDRLVSDYAFGYQWYVDDSYIWEATGQQYIVPQSGNYFVEITDVNGCKASSEDLYVLKENIPDKDLLDGMVTLYPNPFTNFTVLKINPLFEKPCSLEIFTTNGSIVRQYSGVNSDEIFIYRDDLQPGLYFYRLNNGYGVISTGKMFIQ